MRFVFVMITLLVALPAQADILADEKQLLDSCVAANQGDSEKCRCYLGAIKREVPEQDYERAIAFAAASLAPNPAQVAAALNDLAIEFGMSPDDLSKLQRSLQRASNVAAQICGE